MSEASHVWRYQLDNQFVRPAPTLAGVQFTGKWLSVRDGVITVQAGYAWDGCSPSWYLPLLGWVGVPDGPTGKDGLPQSYYPTLVHDALCQFRSALAVDKVTVVQLLRQMLLEYGFPSWRAHLYASVVYWLGPQNWPGRPAPEAA